MTGKTRCNFHSGLASLAGQRGGRRRARYSAEDLAPITPPENSGDVLKVLSQVIGEVHDLRLEPRVANSLAYLSSAYLSALQVADLDERLKALEARHDVLQKVRGGR
jgi:hypothetical protein